MIGPREFFLEPTERALNIKIVLGDDRTVRVVGVGNMTFERESFPPLKVMDVLYVLGMKKNLISVSAMEKKGFDVTFSGGKVLMHPRGDLITLAKVIGVRFRKLYNISFQSAGALVSSTSVSTHTSTTNSRYLCELWHEKMVHMHHGALRVLRDITTRVLDFSVEHYEVCRGCALGKYTKFPLPTNNNRCIGSSRICVGTGTPGLVGRPSGSPDLGVEDEFPNGESYSGKRRLKWIQDTLKEVKFIGPLKRMNRESVPSEQFCSYVAKATNIVDSKPTSYEDFYIQEVWREAMGEEYASIIKNNAWEVVPRAEGKPVVTSRWLYKIKHVADDNIEKLKARFVAKRFSQIKGVDYDETFTPVAWYTSIRSLISITA
eukprot:PITA_05833